MSENPIPTTTEVTQEDKLWSLLSWILWVPAVIALFMEDKKNRPFIKYNAWVSLITGIVLGVLIAIITAVTCGFGGVTGLAWIYPIYLGIKAYQGEVVTVPFVSDFVAKQGWASKP